MSGIAAVYDRNGACGPNLIHRLTGAMRAFGPDRRSVWTGGPVALGHAMLETTPEDASGTQPFSFDGRWITADARIDGRDELIARLRRRTECADLDRLPDAALILQAYLAWGESCVEFLLGDFAFAIWDEPRQTLFCARDHFGLRPLFYAQTGSRLAFCSSIAALRQEVDTSAIDELAVADFLLFAYKQEQAGTTFQAIRRLPPAHIARIQAGGRMTVRPYWTLPVEEPVRYRRYGEYVEHFRDVFRTAVRDRLRTSGGQPPALLLSGGMDSSAIAASAVKDNLTAVTAFTFSFEGLVRHEEPGYSRQVAQCLGLEQVMLPSNDRAFRRFTEPGFLPEEPLNEPFLAATQAGYQRIAERSRVALTGERGDEVLLNSPNYASYALRAGRGMELLRDIAGYVRRRRRMPRLGLRTAIRRRLGTLPPAAEPPFPSWLNPHYITRLDLTARWERMNSHTFFHPCRPEAYNALAANPYSLSMGDFTPNLTGAALEFRHPFLDLRLVRLALRLPAFPYCVGKDILRSAFARELPASILARRKTPMMDDPLYASLKLEPPPMPSPAVHHCVDVRKLRASLDHLTPGNAWIDVRALVLDHFLQSLQRNQWRETA